MVFQVAWMSEIEKLSRQTQMVSNPSYTACWSWIISSHRASVNSFIKMGWYYITDLVYKISISILAF